MALFNHLRAGSFIAVLAFSLITLGIAGNFLSMIQGVYYSVSNFSALAIAVSVITWAFLLPIFLIGILRRGSFLSWVVVELGICGLLWVLWLATAAYTTSMVSGLTLNCSYARIPEVESVCRQFQALQAFSWLNWIILTLYIGLLLVFAFRASGNGNSVWTSDVNEFNSKGSRVTHEQGNFTPQTQPSMQQQPAASYNQPSTPRV